MSELDWSKYVGMVLLTGELRLFSCNILVAWGLDIPLCQPPLPLRYRHNIGQIWSGFLLLWGRARALLPVSTTHLLCELISITP